MKATIVKLRKHLVLGIANVIVQEVSAELLDSLSACSSAIKIDEFGQRINLDVWVLKHRNCRPWGRRRAARNVLA